MTEVQPTYHVQRSPEWYVSRLGNVTASRMADIMPLTRGGESAARKNYMMELLCQRLTGEIAASHTSQAMDRGIELETVARSMFELATGLTAIETGAVAHKDIPRFSASPDGLVGDGSLIEIKCPNTAQHVDFLITRKIPLRYQWQMLAQMACTGRDKCYFVSYDDRLPDSLALAYEVFLADGQRMNDMISQVKAFLSELDRLESSLGSTK